MARLGAVALLLVPCLWSACEGAAEAPAPAPPPPRKKRGDDSKKTPLPHHSFAGPLEYTSLLDDWSASGSSIFERDRLLIHPGVKQLFGFAWNKRPILTDNFEIMVHFQFQGHKIGTNVPKDQGVGIWYVQENIPAMYNETNVIGKRNWGEGLAEQGFSFLGAKAKFDGFGAVLTPNSRGTGKSFVSLVTNEGGKTLGEESLPSPGAKEIDFRNTLNPAQLRIRVKPDTIEGQVKQSPSLAWNDCFKVDRKTRAGGFFGLTAFSGGAQNADDALQADLVSIVQVEVNNFDENVIGEDMKDVTAQIQDTYREMLTDEHRHFADQTSQTEHLARLIGMLGEYINTTKPAEERLYADVMSLSGRVDQLSTECKNLRQEAHLLLGSDAKAESDLHKAGVEAMKNEIVGLKRILTKDSAAQRQKLDAVHNNVKNVKKFSSASQGSGALMKQAESLEKTVVSRGTQMTWMMFMMLASVVGIGGLMYHRMHYYEKKHFV